MGAVDPATPWSPTWIDAVTGDGGRGTRINALREELGRERLVSFFTSADELAQQVGAAVTNLIARLATSPRYQLREGLPTVLVGRAWTIPPPVRSFTGRDEQLSALHTQLTGQGAATLVPTAALTGMGGVGKTQLALAYAQRYRGEYELGWWVPAETELGMVTALADLGAALGLAAELAAGARDALGGRSGLLLILDNAPEPAAVSEFLPGAGGGHVLVTSRDSGWQGIADPVPVDLLPRKSAVGLLLRRSGDPHQQTAARLAEALGRLPLALEQAAAYAASERISLALPRAVRGAPCRAVGAGQAACLPGHCRCHLHPGPGSAAGGQAGGGTAAGAVRAPRTGRDPPASAAQQPTATSRAARRRRGRPGAAW